MRYIVIGFLLVLLFASCASKKPLSSKSSTIIFQTKDFKFYDKGFITKYSDRINVTIFSFGQVALNLDIYPDRVCQDDYKCLGNKEFNEKYFSKEYEAQFLYKLFSSDRINFKDKSQGIKIKLIDK